MKKTILVTGSTGSILKTALFELARRDCNLILVGRNEIKLRQLKLKILSQYSQINIAIYYVDLAEPDSINELIQKLKMEYKQLDGLILSATTFENERKVNSRGVELMFATNYLGPFQLTLSIVDLLKAAPFARIMNIVTPNHTRLNFADLFFERKYSASKAYEASRNAAVLFTFKLAQVLSWTFVSTFVFDPGLLKSELAKTNSSIFKLLLNNVARNPEKLGKPISYFMLGTFEDTINAKLVKPDLSVHNPSSYFQMLENLNKLWDISNECVIEKPVLQQ